MRFAPYLICLGLALVAPFACSSTPTTTTAIVRPQLVAVDPADFMGRVPCQAPRAPVSDASGEGGAAGEQSGVAAPRDPNAAHSYIATLFDVTPTADGSVPDPATPLASSAPTSCLQQVTFAFVVAGHSYLAEIDAYREDPSELMPINAGSRLVTDSQGTRVVPSWGATCGGYPASPYVEAGTDSGGAEGTAETAGGGRQPGVVSYGAITTTPHDCREGLSAPDGN